jgi:hypothetical protein
MISESFLGMFFDVMCFICYFDHKFYMLCLTHAQYVRFDITCVFIFLYLNQNSEALKNGFKTFFIEVHLF